MVDESFDLDLLGKCACVMYMCVCVCVVVCVCHVFVCQSGSLYSITFINYLYTCTLSHTHEHVYTHVGIHVHNQNMSNGVYTPTNMSMHVLYPCIGYIYVTCNPHTSSISLNWLYHNSEFTHIQTYARDMDPMRS